MHLLIDALLTPHILRLSPHPLVLFIRAPLSYSVLDKGHGPGGFEKRCGLASYKHVGADSPKLRFWESALRKEDVYELKPAAWGVSTTGVT